MKTDYLNLYNNLIKLTTNKFLYKGILEEKDNFSDRLTLFLLHFAFFLKEFKNHQNEKILQEIYDFNFRQLELSIREIGYGDQSINKKMKDYINVLHAIVSEIHFWENLSIIEKEKKISIFLSNFKNIKYLVEYFEDYRENLSKNTLNSYLKSVSTQ
ncbi:ubiquinol-cytochrome C chaperone family protein [Candidatus Pelagibacter sp.]|jgi:cytochrome b pre-mRNA-processing protein 3|nr:ubiquinol-cytochrome C chaperone family protein [Candidatus Pelagibacter sp.]